VLLRQGTNHRQTIYGVMMFNLLLAETRAGGATNEDVAGNTTSAAWVIDGASGVGDDLLPAASDAQWFARTVDAELRRLLLHSPTLPFENLFRTVVARCEASYAELALRPPNGRHELPSAAIAFVRALPDRIEFATLGDCQILYRTPSSDGVAEHGNGGQIGPFEERTKATARSIVTQNPGISAAALFEALRPHLIENRAAMNLPGGYWVLGLQQEAIQQADRIELPLGDWDIALASDGFLRLSDTFDHIHRSALLSIRTLDAFNHWYTELRQLECAHKSLEHYPRAKISDDATFVRVSVRAERATA
jgi:Protein phosphatase 2C